MNEDVALKRRKMISNKFNSSVDKIDFNSYNQDSEFDPTKNKEDYNWDDNSKYNQKEN